jgi:hypothetical protein
MADREQKSVRKAAKKAAARPGPRADKADGEAAVLARIAAMPALQPTLCYGMPWYAKDGKRVFFFFRADKYMRFGLTEEASLTREEGAPHQLLASAWYFTALDDPTEAKLSAIVRTAAR